MSDVENLENICSNVLGCTRTRYNERGAQVSFRKGSTTANANGISGIAIGSGRSIYEVKISSDFSPFPTKENLFQGSGEISCSCADFHKMNPSGTIPFKLDPCKHLMAIAHRFVHRNDEDKGAEKLEEIAKPTHLEIPEGVWVEKETQKAYLATIAGVKGWWPKSHVILQNTVTYISLWLAAQQGISGKEVVFKPTTN